MSEIKPDTEQTLRLLAHAEHGNPRALENLLARHREDQARKLA